MSTDCSLHELTTTFTVEIVMIITILTLVQREDIGNDHISIRKNIRILLWMVLFCLIIGFIFHLINIPFGWYITSRIFSIIFIFLNLTVCFGICQTLKINTNSSLYILLISSLFLSILDLLTNNKYQFIDIINILVAVYTLNLIKKLKMKIYDNNLSILSFYNKSN